MRLFFVGAIAALGLGLAALFLLSVYSVWFIAAAIALLLIACYLAGMGSLMLYESKIGKVRGRETLLDQIVWRGDESVLDVGCGRGLMLVGAARRLTNGKAIGVDIWRSEDQSANQPEGALHNARIEGVAGRIEIDTADARQLPFQNGAFDVVVSHWVVHNLAVEADREIALKEMARVLRPGGHLILTDIEHRDAYMRILADLGLTDRRLSFNPVRDAILNLVSFGSFRPATIFARKPS